MKKQIKQYLTDLGVLDDFTKRDDHDYSAIKILNLLMDRLLNFIQDDYFLEDIYKQLLINYDEMYRFLVIKDFFDRILKHITDFLLELEEYEKLAILRDNLNSYVY